LVLSDKGGENRVKGILRRVEALWAVSKKKGIRRSSVGVGKEIGGGRLTDQVIVHLQGIGRSSLRNTRTAGAGNLSLEIEELRDLQVGRRSWGWKKWRKLFLEITGWVGGLPHKNSSVLNATSFLKSR